MKSSDVIVKGKAGKSRKKAAAPPLSLDAPVSDDEEADGSKE